MVKPLRTAAIAACVYRLLSAQQQQISEGESVCIGHWLLFTFVKQKSFLFAPLQRYKCVLVLHVYSTLQSVYTSQIFPFLCHKRYLTMYVGSSSSRATHIQYPTMSILNLYLSSPLVYSSMPQRIVYRIFLFPCHFFAPSLLMQMRWTEDDCTEIWRQMTDEHKINTCGRGKSLRTSKNCRSLLRPLTCIRGHRCQQKHLPVSLENEVLCGSLPCSKRSHQKSATNQRIDHRRVLRSKPRTV